MILSWKTQMQLKGPTNGGNPYHLIVGVQE